MVLWIIGLSGSGKTSLSRIIYDRLKPKMPNLVRLDGYVIRELFGNDVDHSIEGRRINAQRLSRLCKFFSDQDIHIIAAVLSIFPEWRNWNREYIPGYAEIYLKVSMEVLKTRDRKNLYKSALAGKMKNVVGVDIAFPEPANPDMVIDNDKDRDTLEEIADRVMAMPVIKSIREDA